MSLFLASTPEAWLRLTSLSRASLTCERKSLESFSKSRPSDTNYVFGQQTFPRFLAIILNLASAPPFWPTFNFGLRAAFFWAFTISAKPWTLTILFRTFEKAVKFFLRNRDYLLRGRLRENKQTPNTFFLLPESLRAISSPDFWITIKTSALG